jgi:hypothetical protein
MGLNAFGTDYPLAFEDGVKKMGTASDRNQMF